MIVIAIMLIIAAIAIPHYAIRTVRALARRTGASADRRL